MSGCVGSFNLFLVQVAASSTPSRDFVSTTIPVLSALVGVLTGLFAAWKNQSDVYKDRLEQYKSAFDRNLESVKNAFDAEKRSLLLLMKQKESDIRSLKERVKRLEGFYTINFKNIDEKDDVLEKLLLFLKYAEHRVQEEDFSEELRKVEDYLKSHLGLVNRQQLRFEAVDWLNSNHEFLVNSATKHILHSLSQSNQGIQSEIEESIKAYLKRLRVMLNAGLGTESDPAFIERTKHECDSKHLSALTYLKDYQVGAQISHAAREEFEQCIDALIEIIS